MEGHPQGSRRAQAALRAHRARGDHRRRVHGRAPRCSPRRSSRRSTTSSPTSTSGTDAVVRSPEVLEERLRLRATPERPGVARRRRAPDARRVDAAEGNVAGPYAQIVDKHGKAIGGNGPPTFGLGWDHESEAQPVPHRRPAGRRRRADEIVIDRHTADDGNLKVGDRVTVLTDASRRRSTRSSVPRGSGPPTAWPARRSRSSRCPRRSASGTRSTSSARSASSRSPA